MTRVSPDSQLEKGQHRHWYVSRAGDQQHDQITQTAYIQSNWKQVYATFLTVIIQTYRLREVKNTKYKHVETF